MKIIEMKVSFEDDIDIIEALKSAEKLAIEKGIEVIFKLRGLSYRVYPREIFTKY